MSMHFRNELKDLKLGIDSEIMQDNLHLDNRWGRALHIHGPMLELKYSFSHISWVEDDIFDEFKTTALSLFHVLLEYGAKHDHDAFQVAIYLNDIESIRKFVDEGIEVNYEVMQKAVELGNMEIFNFLHTKFNGIVTVDLINIAAKSNLEMFKHVQNIYGLGINLDALFISAEYNNFDITKHILKQGIRPNINYEMGQNILVSYIRNGNVEATEYLLSLNVEWDFSSDYYKFNVENKEVLNILLKNNIDIAKFTSISSAINSENLKENEEFTDLAVNYYSKNYPQDLLKRAIEIGNLPILIKAIENGASIFSKKYSAFDHAAKFEKTGILLYLINHAKSNFNLGDDEEIDIFTNLVKIGNLKLIGESIDDVDLLFQNIDKFRDSFHDMFFSIEKNIFDYLIKQIRTSSNYDSHYENLILDAAIISEDVDAVKESINRGAEIDQWSELYLKNSSFEILKFMYDTNSLKMSDAEVLHLAATFGVKEVEYFIDEKHIAHDLQDEKGNNILMKMTQKGYHWNYIGDKGNNAMNTLDVRDVGHLLDKYDFDINHENTDGKDVLSMMECVYRKDFVEKYDAKVKDCHSVLRCAINENEVDFWVEKGALINSANSIHPMAHHIQDNNLNVLEHLVELGCLTYQKDKYGNDALDFFDWASESTRDYVMEVDTKQRVKAIIDYLGHDDFTSREFAEIFGDHINHYDEF